MTSSASYFYLPSPNGRLTLTSGVPITTSDVTAATTLFYTPYKGNTVQIYNGTYWNTYGFTEISLSISAFAGNNCFNIFIYNNSGTLTLTDIAWTNHSTRATSLTLQNGQYVSSSNSGYLYLGTIYTSNGGQTQDAVAGRYLWNYYNRIHRYMNHLTSTVQWNYGANVWRQANNDSTNLVQFVIGLQEDIASANVVVYSQAQNSNGASVGIGLNSTGGYVSNSLVGGWYNPVNTMVSTSITARWEGFPVVGYNYVAWLENVTGGTCTYYGVNSSVACQSGIMGSILA